MKFLIAAIAAFAAIPAVAEYQPDAERAAFASQFKSANPKIVKDVFWRSSGALLVGVLDTGSRRDALASSYCEDLREFGIKGQVRISVMDIAKITTQNKWVKLGEHNCKQ